MMMFFKNVRAFFNKPLNPHKLVNDKREANLRKIFGKDLLSFDSWLDDGCSSRQYYRVEVRLPIDLKVFQIYETMRGCIEWCCGGTCPDKSITIDYGNKKVKFVVEPKYGDAESLPDGATKGVAK